MRWWRLGALPSVALFVVLLALIGIGTGLIFAQQHLSQASRDLERATHESTKLDQVLTHLINSETGQRGYLLTGDRAFLRPYEEYAPRIIQLLDEIDGLSDGDPARESRLSDVRRLALARIALMESTLVAFETGGIEAAIKGIRQGDGHETMEKLRAHLAELRKAAQDRLSARAARMREQRTLATIGAALVVSIGILIGISAVLINKRLRGDAERIARSNRLFAEVLNNMGDVYYMMDANWRLQYANRAAVEFFAPPDGILVGKQWGEVVPSARGSTIEQRLAAAMASGKPDEIEFQSLHRPDHYLSLRMIPGAFGLAVFIRDRTEQKRLQEQLIHALKLESVGRLAGGVAHDFNNLLTAIVGSTDLAMAKLAQSDPAAEHLRNVHSASDRAATLTRQLLTFARKQVTEPRVVSMNDVVSGIEPLLRRLLPASIHLHFNFAPDLWACEIDPGQFEQAILNLCANARDAMESGGELTLETVNARLDDEYVRLHPGVAVGEFVMLAVSDTGVGMESAIQKHIFEPFFTTKERGKGTGLGLASCYGTVKQCGGHIWLYSEPGRGTTFKLYVPRAVKPLSDAPSRVATPTPRGNETILVVEDEPMVREIAVQSLRVLGYRTLAAEDAEAGLEKLEEQAGEIALVLTDVILPGMSGKHLSQIIQERWPHIAVLFTSGYTANAIVHNGVLDADVAFLQKPYTPSLLGQRVREVLSAKQRG